MKILTLSTVFPNSKHPNLGVFVRERMLNVAKHAEIKVVAPVPWFPFSSLLKPGYRPSVPRVELQDGIEIFHPRFFSFPGIFKSLDGFLLFVSLILPLIRIKKEFAFDIIDSHFAYPEGFGATLLGRIFKRPVTITLRGTIVPLSRITLRRVQIVYALKNADKIFSVSDSLKNKAVSLGIQPDKIIVIPNGVDNTKFYPMDKGELREALSLPADAKIIISVGALVKRKGFHRVINLLPDIIKQCGNLLYVIVGGPSVEGDFSPHLRRLVSRLGLENNVVFTGMLDHVQIREWLNASDIFCLATSNEGWANVFFEAMACGKPVVATRVGGNEEVIKNQDYGILVDANDNKQLASAILQALDKNWDTDKITSYASIHDWGKVGDTVYMELKRVVSKYIQDRG